MIMLGMKVRDQVFLLALSLLVSLACKSAPKPLTASSAAENDPNLAVRAKELGDALGRKDYEKVVDLTYSKVIEIGGGREKLLAAMTSELKSMQAEGVEIISSNPSSPTQFYHDGTGIFAVVPMTSKFKARDGTFQLEGSLIAISTDGGTNWTFVDATGKEQTELKKVLPNLDKLHLPPEKEPVKVTN